jgi:D-arabinose 1-dehydrogenase-like Zn-dependent alcohol dehydrogenase
MRSYKITQFGQPLEAVEEPTPEPTGTQVLLKVDACGVCHSDLHLWHGVFKMANEVEVDVTTRGITLPHTLGHEVVGEVVALGPEAKGVKLGDKRLVYTWIGCGDCAVCQAGDENLCDNPRSIGIRRAGGYADHVLLPHADCLIDYEGVPAPLACLYACSGVTVYNALGKLAPLTPDDHVLLVGAGGLGLMAIKIARALGNPTIITADIDEAKRAAALEAGAHHAVDAASPEAAAEVIGLSGGGVKGAIDLVGAPASAEFAIASIRKGGTVVFVGLYGGGLTVSLPLFPFRAMTLTGSYVGNLRQTKELIRLAQAGRIEPIPYETRPLDAAGQALQDLEEGHVLGRVVLTP